MSKQTLTHVQQHVVDELKRLHLAGEPLNITAARRNHPDLLDAAYGTTRFWGWRAALEDAGIAYPDVRMELADHAICRICGATGRRLEQHIRAHHHVSAERYYERFPDDDLTCDEIRAAQFARSNGTNGQRVPHWEPLWTRPYILDRLALLKDQGLPMNPSAVLKEEPRLYRRTLHYFTHWDAALAALHIKPETTRLAAARHEWTRESIIKALCRRALTAKQVNRAAVRKDEPSLEYAAARSFGSYNKALQAAGLDVETVRKRATWKGKYTTRQSVIDAIVMRAREGLPLNDRGVTRGPERDCALYSKARRMFGSWRQAVTASHLNYDQFSAN